jgi:hypothetical protein
LMAWIADHAGVAEVMVSEPARRGLHGPLIGLSSPTQPRTPLRFVLPAGTLTEPPRAEGSSIGAPASAPNEHPSTHGRPS